MVARQYDIWLVNLDPTLGAEMKKTRPCVVVSPDAMNRHLRTVQIAPMTSNTTPYPWRAAITFRRKRGVVALDQLRTIDKKRLVTKLGKTTPRARQAVKDIIHEMLVM